MCYCGDCIECAARQASGNWDATDDELREAHERLAEALAACTAALNVEHRIREALRASSLFQTKFAEEFMRIVGGVTDACQVEANAAAERLALLDK